MVDGPAVKRGKVTDLLPDAHNANRGTERGLALLENSLRKYGVGRGIVVDKHGRIIGGNKTVERLVDLGITDAILVQTDGNALVVTQRTDLDLDTDPAARELAYADNRVGQVDLDFDLDVLLADLQRDDLNLSDLWRDDEIAQLVAEARREAEGEPGGDPGAALDRAEELRTHYGVERGQLWQVGKHRIGCLDAYNADDVARLLDGKTPGLAHFDPPYGINIVKPRGGGSAADIGGAKPFGATGETRRKGASAVAFRNCAPGKAGGGNGQLVRDHAAHGHVQHGAPSPNQIIQSNLYPVIQGDERPFDPIRFLDAAPIVVLWGANYYADKLPTSAGWIVWDKREGITRNNFADCELAWSNQDKPARIFYHLWNGLHKGSQHGQARTHPTEKPIALFEEIGKSLCPGGLWLDLFAGTGAQVIAAEHAGATCYAAEIEPLYVATILWRGEQVGLTPQLVEVS